MVAPVTIDATRQQDPSDETLDDGLQKSESEEKRDYGHLHFSSGGRAEAENGDVLDFYFTERLDLSMAPVNSGVLQEVSFLFGFGPSGDHQVGSLFELNSSTYITGLEKKTAEEPQQSPTKELTAYGGAFAEASMYSLPSNSYENGVLALTGGAVWRKSAWLSVLGVTAGVGIYSKSTGETMWDDVEQEEFEINRNLNYLFVGGRCMVGSINDDGSFMRVITLDGRVSPWGWQWRTNEDIVARNGYLSGSVEADILAFIDFIEGGSVGGGLYPLQINFGIDFGSQETRYDPPIRSRLGFEYWF